MGVTALKAFRLAGGLVLRSPALLICLLALPAAMARAGEFQLGLSYIPLLTQTPAVHVNFRPEGERIQFGYKYERWHDEYSGITQSQQSRQGPLLLYRFDTTGDASNFVGIEWLHWQANERPIAPGGNTARSSDTALYLGVGRTGDLSDLSYYNLAIYLGPNAKQISPSRANGNASSGSFDLHLQVGLRF